MLIASRFRKTVVPGTGFKSRMNKGFARVWGIFLFPKQNFTSVSAGRNRDNLEKQVRLILYARFWHGLDFGGTLAPSILAVAPSKAIVGKNTHYGCR